MNTKYQYHIDGQLRSAQEVSFADADIAICALVAGKEVGSALVDKNGKYSLSFDDGSTPPAVELRLVPNKLRQQADESSVLAYTVSPRSFVHDTGHGSAYRANNVDISISKRIIDLLQEMTKTYHLYGYVYSFNCFPLHQQSATPPVPLPHMRIDFYEVNQLIFFLPQPPPPTERFLGTAYTDQYGQYDFKFQFTTNFHTLVFFGDGKPDIKVRISQFFNGEWCQVYEGMTDWEITENFPKDYNICQNYLKPVVPIGETPPDGFLYHSLGFLPIMPTGNDKHIDKGYGTSLTSDPFYLYLNINHQPFCGTLSIFGYFAKPDVSRNVPTVPFYRVQIAPADENGPIGGEAAWKDVFDPLCNRKNNVPRVLGPSGEKHLYQNIDIEDFYPWDQHSLKVMWNSANQPDGYYALRIMPYDGPDGNPFMDSQGKVISYLMPVLRIDNSLPEVINADLMVDETKIAVTPCGNMKLPENRYVPFTVKASSPSGHILWYNLWGNRGKHGDLAGGVSKENPITITKTKGTGKNWDLPEEQNEDFYVVALSKSKDPDYDLTPCATIGIAYHFELCVQGSATNGIDSALESRRVYKNVNLIITE